MSLSRVRARRGGSAVPVLGLSMKHASPGDRDDTIFALMYIHAVMFFPNDKAKRTAFFNSCIAAPFAEVLDDPGIRNVMSTVDVETAAWLGKYGSLDPLRMAKEAGYGHDGIKAAYILLLPMLANLKYGLQFGRTAAYRAINEWCARRREPGASERHLKTIWQTYQGVAHLWAAFEIARDIPTDIHRLRNFLSFAELIRQSGIEFIPNHSKFPLIDASVSWQIPESVLVDFTADLDEIEFQDQWLELIKKHARN